MEYQVVGVPDIFVINKPIKNNRGKVAKASIGLIVKAKSGDCNSNIFIK